MSEYSDTRLSVIIPAFNEELRLPRTLDQVMTYLTKQSYRSEVIVVNDGSTDNTAQVVQNRQPGSVPLKLLQHLDSANHGKGESVKRGMLEACGECRLFMDADNSTTLDQVERFWDFLNKGCEVMIGSRAHKESVIRRRQSILKELAGRIGNLLVQVLAVPGIHDTQAGFKMFTAEAAQNIFPKQTIKQWGYDIEILAIARTLGYKVCEIPITWLNAPGSKVTTGTYFEVLGEIWKIRQNLRAGLYK